jgi:hypothetical protein
MKAETCSRLQQGHFTNKNIKYSGCVRIIIIIIIIIIITCPVQHGSKSEQREQY